ncbi:pectate lyase-like adhesive domain-containing protein [Listeria sp. ILCC792]|uniref:pectate lyase-like adhesive domain-containing protein n=1 Tax=Listeria sp. ILCC792 TaxID=1918331 RepID=UPI000B588B71|nr:pectate lyase-like adhesive domain-containing protein [Listeria sp. ILCC792]
MKKGFRIITTIFLVASLAIIIPLQGSGVFDRMFQTVKAEAENVANVTTYQELETAMGNQAITEINIMNDIEFTNYPSTSAGEVNVTVPARSITINGNNHHVDFRKRGYLMNFGSTKINITLQNIKMYGQNYWGPFRIYGTAGVGSTFTFDNIEYTGAQLTASYQADVIVKGTVKNASVNSYVSPFNGTTYNALTNQTNLEVTNITFTSGSNYTGTTENATVLMLGTGGTKGNAVIEEGAKLNLTGGGNGLSGEGQWTTIQLNGNFEMQRNSEVNITTPNASTRGGIQLGNDSKLLVQDDAKLTLNMDGPFTDAYNKNPINVGTNASFEVADGASLIVNATSQGTGTGALVYTGTSSLFKIGKKSIFKLKADGTGAKNLIRIGGTSTFSFEDAGEVDIDASANTNANTRPIYMVSGSFKASIQRVKAWTTANVAGTPTYDWYPMYDMNIPYVGANVQTTLTGNSITQETQDNFIANYRTQNFKRVLFEYIPDVSVIIDALSDNKTQANSHTITGITNPNAWVMFSGDSAIPTGTIPAQDKSDTKMYHVKADASGNYTYTLPDGQFFSAGNTVVAYAYLDGKNATTNTVVSDETPPDKPVLSPIKDVDASIKVKAEPNVTVTIYDSSDKRILASGTSNTEDYEISIPADKRPLAPYVSYYATATDSAGNISEQSNFELVSDTTPPEANPITQTVQLGAPFTTDAKSLVENVFDNAGLEDLTYTIISEPDVSRIGHSTAVVRIQDRAANYRDFTIPVFVEDGSTSSNNDAMLTSTDFTILAQSVPATEAELDELIVTNGQVKAWKKPSGEDITDQVVIVNRGGLSSTPGEYDVKISVLGVERTIHVTVKAGTLEFKEIPTDISFGNVTIKSKPQLVTPKNDVKITIEDSRATPKEWTLMAQLTTPLATDSGDALNSLVIRTKQNGVTDYLELTDQGTTPVYTNKSATTGTTVIDLNTMQDEGILLNVLPGLAKAKAYYTKIRWTLQDAP